MLVLFSEIFEWKEFFCLDLHQYLNVCNFYFDLFSFIHIIEYYVVSLYYNKIKFPT